MKFALFSAKTLEPWNWTTHDVTGIGGSEVAHIEMARRLAARGHEVVSFIPFDASPTFAEGVTWKDSASIAQEIHKHKDFTWFVYRSPTFFNLTLPPGQYYFVAQDVSYDWTPGQLEKLTGYICLCEEHCKHTYAQLPSLDGKIFKSSNGIRRELIERIEKEKIKRDPKKIIYASSPDRGLTLILKDWFRVREAVPDAALHVFYGRNNMHKIMESGQAKHLEILDKEIDTLLDQPGVTWRGRINQGDLVREMFSAAIWWYPTDWPETSCIQCMEQQACGAVPVTNKHWALKQNVLSGVCLSGGVPQQDNLTRASLTREVIRLLQNPVGYPERKKMMLEARREFDWDKFVTQFEKWGIPDAPPAKPKKKGKKK